MLKKNAFVLNKNPIIDHAVKTIRDETDRMHKNIQASKDPIIDHAIKTIRVETNRIYRNIQITNHTSSSLNNKNKNISNIEDKTDNYIHDFLESINP